MGRVDDAFRRAREAGDAPAPSNDSVAPAESFPQEPAVEAASPPPVIAPLLARDGSPELEAPAADENVSTAEATEEANDLHLSAQLDAKVVIDRHIMPGSREEYRRLAAALHHAQEASGIRVVMIASAVAGEGKSLTAANLALTLSESYKRRVLLVDGDLRRPVQHRFFGLEAPSGLSDLLTAVDEPQLTLYDVSPTLTVLPAGRPSADPMAGLTSTRMRQLLNEARGPFDWVLIDTPPVALMSDANLLAAMVDAAVLVIRAGATPYEAVQRAAEAVGRDRILGAVLNRAAVDRRAAYDYYHYYNSADANVTSG